MTRGLIEIDELKALLVARIGSLACELAPDGRRAGHEWIARNPARSDHKAGSFSINLTSGLWADFATNDKGDALELVAYLACAGDRRRAIGWAKAWLGLDGADPAKLARQRATAQAAVQSQRSDGEKRIASIRSCAFRLWLDSRASIANTAAADYLVARGIDLAPLGRQPAALRFHPGLVAPDDQGAPDHLRVRWPALLAAIHVPGIKGVGAVHRTYLQRQPDGRVTKAPLSKAKLALGSFVGGSIRLWRGASGKPLEEAPAGEWVTVTEGIEDALSVALARPEKRVIAAVSLSNVGGLVMPQQIAGIEIAAQNDPAGSDAAHTLARSIEKLQRRGLSVRVVRPPAAVKDWNDLLRQAVGSAAA